jgi:hypothetical protein
MAVAFETTNDIDLVTVAIFRLHPQPEAAEELDELLGEYLFRS